MLNVSSIVACSQSSQMMCYVLQHVDFQGKCKLQLVCRKFRALLSTPSPGLWGQLNLVIDIMNRGQKDRISGQVPENPTLLRMP